MNLIEKARKYVRHECFKRESKYGSEPYEFHFKPTAKYATALVREFGADEEIVVSAAWLHDIGSIVYGRKNHEITGAKIAAKKLKAWGCSEAKIEAIRNCILNHRGSKRSSRRTIEERIVAEADAMAHFDTIPGLFQAAFTYEHLDQGQARESVRKKLIRSYRKLSFKSRALIKPCYEAAMLLLS